MGPRINTARGSSPRDQDRGRVSHGSKTHAPPRPSGARADVMPLDVRVAGQMEAVFDRIAKEWGKLDFVVHSIEFAPQNARQARMQAPRSSAKLSNGFGSLTISPASGRQATLHGVVFDILDARAASSLRPACRAVARGRPSGLGVAVFTRFAEKW